MRILPAFALLLLAVPAAAQTRSPPPAALGTLPAPIVTRDGVVAVPYGAPNLDEDAAPADFLRAARQSLAAGRITEAMEALERAQTRALTRDVRPSRAGIPSDQSLVAAIAAAQQALAVGDRLATIGKIDEALRLGE
ncbi:MAG: hypothetical protein NT133_23095 [Alphaproteobacteria bacterium]|nr:hypothetical protein [Alphaproteobacteria bacterium]